MAKDGKRKGEDEGNNVEEPDEALARIAVERGVTVEELRDFGGHCPQRAGNIIEKPRDPKQIN